MTVGELIDRLNDVEDKGKRVEICCECGNELLCDVEEEKYDVVLYM